METSGADALSDDARVQRINQRVEEMRKHYFVWSKAAKRSYHFWNVLTIVFSAAVPVVVLIAPLVHSAPTDPWVPAVAGILGAAATLSKSLDSVYKNHDTWLRNNSAYGKLTSERFMFEERAGVYKGISTPDAIALYAVNVNNLIGAETDQWSSAETAPAPGATA
jgi:hypothetical protein